jgi:hypothetical protein
MSLNNFPKQKLPFNKKDKKWRKAHLDFADNNSFINSGRIRAKLRSKRINLNLYNGILDPSDMKLILNPGDIEKMFVPDKIQHYPIVTPRINVLIGEEKRRKFDWSVNLTNPNTVSMISQDKKKLVQEKLNEYLESTRPEEELEKDMKAFSDYINYDYQDIREKRVNMYMRYHIESLDMKVKFQQGFKDALIMGEEIYMTDIVNGQVTFEKLNPLNVHTLRSGTSNKIEDADIIVIDDYWSPGKVQDHFYEDLKSKEIDLLDEESTGGSGKDSDGESYAFDDASNYEVMQRETVNSFLDMTGVWSSASKNTYSDGHGNIRVLRMFWKSKKEILKVTYFDDMGKEQIKFRSPDYILDKERGETSERFWVNEWWKGVKVGKNIYLQIKPKEIQYNKINQPSYNSSGIVGQVYNTNEQGAVSLVERSKPFQYLYDISWYRVNEALSKYLGSIVELDLAKIPEGWNVTKWLYFARKSGIAVVDSFKEGNRGMAKGKLAGAVGNTTGRVLEQKVGDFIQTHIQMMEFAKAQMDEIIGVSRQRMGQVDNRETVGGVERSVSQSNHITEELFTLHDYCKKRCFQILLETIKIAAKGNQVKFAYIADDMTRKLMEIDGDEFAEEEYGLQVSNEDAINEMQQKLDGMVQMGLQNQMLSFSTAMKIYNSPSIREVQRMIEKAENDKNESMQKQSEEQRKMQEMQIQSNEQLAATNQEMLVEQFNRTDETKRYIAELQAETDRLKIEQSGQDLVQTEDDSNDDLEYSKFQEEMSLKHGQANNDMTKHRDMMAHKAKELEVKKKQANKPASSK